MLKNHYTETLLLVLAIVMGCLMAIAIMLVDAIPFNLAVLFQIWSMITLVIILVSIFVPYKKWSAAFVRKIGLDINSLTGKLADGIVPSLVLNTCNTFIVSGATIFAEHSAPMTQQAEIWLKSCVREWPITLVISYFVAFFAEYCGKKVADRFAGDSHE